MKKDRKWITKDSGKREIFKTGAVREIQSGKGRYDLISPFALQRLADVYERGAIKYGERNYEKGIPLSRFLDSALRHIVQLMKGENDEDHAAQALWNIVSFIHTEELIYKGLLSQELNNLPDYKNKISGE